MAQVLGNRMPPARGHLRKMHSVFSSDGSLASALHDSAQHGPSHIAVRYLFYSPIER